MFGDGFDFLAQMPDVAAHMADLISILWPTPESYLETYRSVKSFSEATSISLSEMEQTAAKSRMLICPMSQCRSVPATFD